MCSYLVGFKIHVFSVLWAETHYGLSTKCPPQVYTMNMCSPVGGTIWGDGRKFWRYGIASETKSLSKSAFLLCMSDSFDTMIQK